MTPSKICWLSAVTLAVLVVLYLLTGDRQPSGEFPPTVPTSGAEQPGSRAAPTLQFVAVFSRHGNRAPVFSYPTSQYHMNDTKYWPYGPGQITKGSRVQMFKLGKKIRSLYNGFLSELYHPGDIVVYSTNFDRCFQSAELILAGLFPPRGFQVWNSELLWQPIPVYYTDRDHVRLILPYETRWCSKFHEEKKKSLSKLEQEFGSNLTKLLEDALPHTSFDMGNNTLNTSIVSMWLETYTLWESLVNPEIEGLQLPVWTSEIYPQTITPLVVEAFKAVTSGSDTMLRLLSGQLFQEVVDLMKARLDNEVSAARRLYLYNGHDFTMIGLQRILGLTDSTCHWIVETSSALILELHKNIDTNRSYVKVLYIDGVSKDLEPVELDIPGCDSSCDFYKLTNVTEKYYNITDWKTECES